MPCPRPATSRERFRRRSQQAETKYIPETNLQYAPWGGQACNPYDTARVPRGTSNGSGVSVSANLATCGICEQTSASCKGPASQKRHRPDPDDQRVLMDGGAMYHESGRSRGHPLQDDQDAALVLDVVKGFKSEDMFTAIAKGIIPKKPYSSFLVPDSAVNDKPLKGMRIAIVREFMVKHTKNDAAISDQMDKEIKEVLRDKLGAELVESVDPMYPDDPTIPNVTYSFRDAMAEILPTAVPEYFFRTKGSARSFGEGAKSQRLSRKASWSLPFRVGMCGLPTMTLRCRCTRPHYRTRSISAASPRATQIHQVSSRPTSIWPLVVTRESRIGRAGWTMLPSRPTRKGHGLSMLSVGGSSPCAGFDQLSGDAGGYSDDCSQGHAGKSYRRVCESRADHYAVSAGRST